MSSIELFGDWPDIFRWIGGEQGRKPVESESVSVRETLTKRPPILESISLKKTPQGEIKESAQEIQKFNALLGEECVALDRSLGQIVDVMKASTVEDFESRVSKWVNDYQRSASQLKLAYNSMQQTQKFLSKGLATASDPTLQFPSGLRPAVNVIVYTFSSGAKVDYSTGMKYSYEKEDSASGQESPSASKIQSKIGKISDDYKKIIKLFAGISALGGSATWFAKSHIIGRAEASLKMMQDRHKAIESGDIGHELIWIDHVIEHSQGDTEQMKFLLSEQGIDIDDFENELGHEVKPEDLLTKKGKAAVINLLSESLRKEILELNTFVSLQKQQLKDEAASLAVSTTKFGSELAGYIRSMAGMTTYVPSVVSSTLLLVGASLKLHHSKKSFQRLSQYGNEIQQGAVSIDKRKSAVGRQEVAAIDAHLDRMKQANLTNKNKIHLSFKKMAKMVDRENSEKSPVELVALFQTKFSDKFGLHVNFQDLYTLELNKVKKGEALSFLTFIERQTENIVEEVAGHQESMNVSTRNFFRTLAAQKVKAEKPLSKWAIGSSGINVGIGVVGLLTTLLNVVTLVGLASLGIAATWLGLGVSVAIVVGLAVGLGVLYYYKPRLFKSLFSLNAIKANYANLRIARRTFDLVQANHQKNMAAVEALNEKVSIHLGAVEMLERLYSQENEVQKQWAKDKLEALGLIDSSGGFDRSTWESRKKKLEEAQYRKIRDEIGKLTLGHYLELGAFGIGARKVNVGTWVENRLIVIKKDAERNGWGGEEIRTALREAVKTEFKSRNYSFNDRDLSILERIGNRIQSVEDLDNPSFKSSYLIFYATSHLEKDIERQKDKSGKFFDSYNSLRKYSKEHGKRLQVSAFDDTMNRIVYGTAHGNVEKLANKRYKKIQVAIENLVTRYGKDKEIDVDMKNKLVRLGVNLEWLARDLKLENMDKVTTLNDLLKNDVARLILNQCCDRVNIKKKNSEVAQVMNRVIIRYAKSKKIYTKNAIKGITLSDELKQLLAAEGIDVYRVIEALKPTVSVETVGDLNRKEVKREIARMFRVDWYQLFKDAPTNIAKGIQGDLVDPLTAEFLSKELGIDIQTVAKGMSLPEIQQYIAMGGVELDAFLKKREFLATI